MSIVDTPVSCLTKRLTIRNEGLGYATSGSAETRDRAAKSIGQDIRLPQDYELLRHVMVIDGAKKWNVRVLAVLMQWDYGRPERGFSSEHTMFLEPLENFCREAKAFWFDQYMHDTAVLEDQLKKSVYEYNPDIIFFTTYTDQFRTEFLDNLKSQYQTVAWFGDDHWRFNGYTKRYALHYGTCITTDPWAVAKYRALGAKVILSQWAADRSTSINEPLSPDGKYRYDVSFVGARNEVRSWFVNLLAKRGIKVECFGRNWPNGFLPRQQFFDTFRFSRINLNLSNSVQQDIRFVFGAPLNFARWLKSKKRAEQIKARNFEIPLAGGFQLSQYTSGLEHYFNIGTEIAIHTSPDDCALQIEYYLHNPAKRCDMAIKGHMRAIREHTFMHRFADILEQLCGSGASAVEMTKKLCNVRPN